MIDPEPSSSLHNHNHNKHHQHHHHQDVRLSSTSSSASVLPPPPPPPPPPQLHSDRTSLDSLHSFVSNNNNNYQSHPPPVKARSPLSSLGDHIVKAARRLSMTTSSSKDSNNDNSYNPPPSPSLFLRSGTTSPDLHRKRNSTLEDLRQATTSPTNNSKNKEGKVKDKKPLVKMDLFNLRSKNNSNSNKNDNNNNYVASSKSSSQVNLSIDAPSKPLPGPGSPPPPAPPSKETFWKSKGMLGRQQAVCTEDDFRTPPQQNSVIPAPVPVPAPSAPIPASRSGTALLPPAVSQEHLQRQKQEKQEQQQQQQIEQQQGRHQGHSGHTDTDRLMHNREHAHTVEYDNNNRPMQFNDVSLPLRSPSPSPVSFPSVQLKTPAEKKKQHYESLQPPRPPLQQQLQLQQGSRLTSTMSTDLSQLSISSLQDDDSCSSIESDHSLIMEDVFEVYDNFSVDLSSNDTSRQSSLRNAPFATTTTTTITEALTAHQRRESSGDWTIDRYHQQQQQQQQQQQLDLTEQPPRPPAPEPTDKKPLSALERIKRQQKRQSQEQERLAELVLPPELMSKPNVSKIGLALPGADHVLPVREVPIDRIPIQSFHPLATASQVSPLPLIQQQKQQQQQQQQLQESGGSGGAAGEMVPMDPGAAIIGTDSVMLDQLLTLVPGPNRPRLPTQIEWQQGIEELRQRRKDAAALTNSVGRQNSTGSRHSQDSSTDGKSRRHSMPDMPHGQSREDQERQRGDHFRNPMLLNSNSNGGAYSSSTSSSALNSNAAQKRRSGFEDREQQLLQPPIQRQSIAETQAMDVSMIPSAAPADPKKAARKRAGKNGAAIDNNPGQAVASETALDKLDKDVVDIAFYEMLTTMSLPPATVAQLESLPKDRKWAMLQSKDANPSLLQTPQTLPPQFFVDLLLEYAGKKKRSSRDQFAFNVAALTATSNPPTTPTRPMGMWKNFSATNLTGSTNNNNSNNSNADAFSVGIIPPLQPTFQQHLSSLLGKNDKRALEEREQVLKKLRVLIRNGSIRWTGEFIKAGGPLALLQFCQHVQRTEESKLGQRERLLHQVTQCIKAIVPLDGGVESLTSESIFFSLMRTMAIHEAPVLSRTSKDQAQGSKASKTGGLLGIGGGAASGAGGAEQRYRSSSIPKPLPQTRLGHQATFQSSPVLSADQIPTFSSTQSAVHILTSILAREPDLRDRVLKETVADRSLPQNQRKNGEGSTLTYSEWIDYLKEIMHVCGIEAPLSSLMTPASVRGRGNEESYQERSRKNSSPSKVTSMGAGIAAQGCGPSGPSLSIFSLENMRNKRRHSAAATPQGGQSTPNVMTSGIKFEAGEDQEVLAYLTAHLELVSRLVFEMHMSPLGLAFAKSIKQEQFEDYLERLRSIFIRNHELSAQVEDLLIQLSAVPCTTQMMATLLTKDLPTLPPIDTLSYSQQLNRDQQERQQQQQQRPSSGRPRSPTFQQPTSPLMQQLNQRPPVFQQSTYDHDSRRESQIDSKGSSVDIPARTSSLDSLSGTANTHASTQYGNNNSRNNNSNRNSGGHMEPQRMLNDGIAREESRVQQRVSQLHQQQQQQQATRQHQVQPLNGGDRRGRNGVVPAMQGGENSPVHVGGPPSRQVSFKMDGDRHNSNSNNTGRNQNPLPSPLQQQFQQQHFHHQQQEPSGRVSSQIAFRENISIAAPATLSTPRRVSMGPTSPTPTSPPMSPLSPASLGSRAPTVPAKSKHRPSSMDANGAGFGYGGTTSGGGDSRVEKVIIKLDQPRVPHQQQQQRYRSNSSQRPPQSPSATPSPLSRGIPEPRQQDSSLTVRMNVGANGVSAFLREEGVPQTTTTTTVNKSSSTFGYGRRSSLNNSTTTKSAIPNNNSNNSQLGAPKPTAAGLNGASGGGGQGELKPTAHGLNNFSVDGSAISTCSSTTSSGFSATSSSSVSSVSTPSTQTKKHSILTTTTNASSSSPLPLLSPSKLPRKMISSASPTSPLDPVPTDSGVGSTAAATLTPTPTTKKVHQFRNVDFDNRIQEDVRKLASSSSSSSLRNNSNGNNSNNSSSRGHSDALTFTATTSAGAGLYRYEVHATDPKVLEAPIIVPEDMSLIREQYIQAQVNELVLPPMERKA
ncbi:MAG: hypothetical protein J3R72DRAFT_458044 [Linnemannia gamsii]|nr:MAG: hypothetical protein J3R72DRAFT_458044 [Linnemannia gamsii]